MIKTILNKALPTDLSPEVVYNVWRQTVPQYYSVLPLPVGIPFKAIYKKKNNNAMDLVSVSLKHKDKDSTKVVPFLDVSGKIVSKPILNEDLSNIEKKLIDTLPDTLWIDEFKRGTNRVVLNGIATLTASRRRKETKDVERSGSAETVIADFKHRIKFNEIETREFPKDFISKLPNHACSYVFGIEAFKNNKPCKLLHSFSETMRLLHAYQPKLMLPHHFQNSMMKWKDDVASVKTFKDFIARNCGPVKRNDQPVMLHRPYFIGPSNLWMSQLLMSCVTAEEYKHVRLNIRKMGIIKHKLDNPRKIKRKQIQND